MRYDYKGSGAAIRLARLKCIGEATERVPSSPESKNHRKEDFNLVRFAKVRSRFMLWLHENRAAVYRQLLGKGTPESGYCQNPECPNGEGGQPGSLALMRADARYCNAVCRRAAQRVLTAQNQPPKRRYLCGNKRGSLAGNAFTVNSPQKALIRGISAASERDYPQAR